MILDIEDILNNGVTISSSGTSGTPKDFFQHPKKLHHSNLAAIDAQKLTASSKVYTCCKITHAGGLLAQTVPALSIGAHVDIVQFNAYHFVRDIKNYTHSHITPLHAKAIMMTKGFHNLDLTGITITCGADPVTWDIIESFVSKGCKFISNWGMSEIGPVAINVTFDDLDQVKFYKDLCPPNATILGDTAYCNFKIDNSELVVAGDICVVDDWYYTKDLVEQVNGVLFYKGRTNKEVDLWQPKKG